MKNTFLIVDGNSLIHRAFHALPLMDADGIYTNAIYGFLSMLLKAVREENAGYLAVCFDEHGPTFRHEIFPCLDGRSICFPPSNISTLPNPHMRGISVSLHLRRKMGMASTWFHHPSFFSFIL